MARFECIFLTITVGGALCLLGFGAFIAAAVPQVRACVANVLPVLKYMDTSKLKVRAKLGLFVLSLAFVL